MAIYHLFERFNRIDLRLLRRQDERRYDATKVKIAKSIKEST